MKLPAWKGLYVDLSGIPIDHPNLPILPEMCFFSLGPFRFIVGPRGYPWIW